jgi:hypothetical protein
VRKIRRAKTIGLTLVVGVALAAGSFFGTSTVLRSVHPKVKLIAATDFSITTTISSSSTVQTAALLYPGGQMYVWFTAHNPLHVPITVSDMSISAVAAPAECAASNLDLSAASFAGSLPVPAGGTNAVSKPISLKGTANQDSCKSKTFGFTYTGHATYTDVYATTTALSSSLNPSAVGQSVTYTAAVTAAPTSGQDTVPSSPTGTVTFKDGTTTICASVPVVSLSTTVAKATCSPSAYPTAASHSITAVYANTDANFSATTSAVFTQTVDPATTSTVLLSSPNPSIFGQSVTMTASVTATTGPVPTGAVNFFIGTPSGAHTLLGSGTLNALGRATLASSALPGGSDSLYAVFGASPNDATSTSTIITQTVNFTAACMTGTANGGFTVKSGQAICFTATARVNGGVTVQAGGALSLTGASVNGGLTATGASGLAICGANINGNVSVSSSAGFVLIGDGGDDGAPACAGNSISGTVSVTNGTSGLEVGGNRISQSVTLSGNTGNGRNTEDIVPEIEGNTIGGSLTCATTNSPALTNGGQTNTVAGTKSGQCSAAAF